MISTGTPPTPGSAQGRVRWRRFAAIFLPSFGAIGALFVLVAQGALGVSFAVSGQQFTVTASQLTGTGGFEQYGTVDATAGGTQSPVIVSAIGQATLQNLCQSVALPAPLPGFLKITAGTGTPASAANLVVDAVNATGTSTALSGDASFTNINIGQDASTLNSISGFDPNSPANTNTPLKGTFGQQASAVTITNLRQTALATTAGTFTLPGLGLGFSSSGC
jgi:hypothetical protein